EGDPDDAQLEVVLEADGDDGHFWISSRPEGDGPWTRHVTGRIERRSMPWPGAGLDPWSAHSAVKPIADGAALYPQLAEKGLQFGPAFQTLDHLSAGALPDGARIAVCSVK